MARALPFDFAQGFSKRAPSCPRAVSQSRERREDFSGKPRILYHFLPYSRTSPSTATATYFPVCRSRNCTTRCPSRASFPHRLGFSAFCLMAWYSLPPHRKPDRPKTPTPCPCYPRNFALHHHLGPTHQPLGHQSHQSEIEHIPPTQRHNPSRFSILWDKNSQNQIAASH